MKCLLTLLCFSLMSCISSTIAGSGKKFSHLESPEVSRGEVIAELGQPVESLVYSAPTQISKTSQFLKEVARASEDPSGIVAASNRVIVFSPVTNGSQEAMASICDVYSCRGYFERGGLNANFDMPSAMTLGVADLFLIPSAISERRARAKKIDYLSIWYDSEGKYLATARGNLMAEQDAAPQIRPRW